MYNQLMDENTDQVRKPKPVKRESVRACIINGEVAGQDKLLRLVRAPDDLVVLDLNEKLPGPGIYISPTGNDFNKITQEILAAGFNVPVVAIKGWLSAYDAQTLIRADVLGRLKLAKKANKLIIGAAELKGVPQASIQAVFVANDAGTEAQKRAVALGEKNARVITCFNRQTLEGALGVPQCTLVGLSGLDIFAGTLHKYIDFLT